jgi:hypothetical protein
MGYAVIGAKFDAVRTNAEGPEFLLGTSARSHEGKQFKYVQYSEAVAAVAGQVTYYMADTGVIGNIVTSDLSASGGAGTEVGAGVLQAVIADTGYGWIQTKGPATLTIALTAGADGNALTPTGATDGTLDVVVTSVALSHICAYAGDVSAKEIACCFPD